MISVIIPIFNGEKYIDNLVATLSAQSEKDFEVVFVDDGSSDGTANRLDALAADPPFPMVVKHQQNRGVSAARNVGMTLAKGRFICFVDVDDSLATDYLSSLMQAMTQTGCRVIMGYVTRELAELSDQQSGTVNVFNHEAFCREFLYHGNKFSICAGLFDRRVFKDYDLNFWENYRYSEDVHLLWRLFARESQIAVLSRPIYFYNDNPSSTMGKVDERRMDAIKLMKNLEPYVMAYVPKFGPEFLQFAVARHHWSILWQAAGYFTQYHLFDQYQKQFTMRENLKKLTSYPDWRISLSSRLFILSGNLYYRIIHLYINKYRKKYS